MNPSSAEHARARIVRRAVFLLVAVLAFGTSGYTLTEGWPLWDAFFFTLVTISTVGYGDYGLSETGERFTAVLMFVGIGSLTYALSQIMQAAVAFGFDKERQVQRQISNLRDHVIVCGLGRIGKEVCSHLEEAGMGFVAIDRTEETVEEARRLGWAVLAGDATDDNVLIAAGIRRARSLVCVASRDSDNIVVTLSAHSIAPDLEIFSRAEHADSIRKIRRAGATHVVSPVMVGGRRITDAILRPSLAVPLDPALDGGLTVRLFEIRVEKSSPMAGKTIDEIGRDHREVVFVAMAGDDGRVNFSPAPEQRLSPGETYVVAGCEKNIGPFFEAVGRRAA